MVELLLAQPGIAVNAVNWVNSITLHFACRNGRTDMVLRLLVHPGVHVNRWTPIMMAVVNNHVETVRVMAGDGRVELDTADNAGRWPLAASLEEESEPRSHELLHAPAHRGVCTKETKDTI